MARTKTTSLSGMLEKATGRDRALDAAIARQFHAEGQGDEAADYTASVDTCLLLLRRILPGWHWHVGYGAAGVFPYAQLSRGEDFHDADGATVPIALLRAMVRAAEAGRQA